MCLKSKFKTALVQTKKCGALLKEEAAYSLDINCPVAISALKKPKNVLYALYQAQSLMEDLLIELSPHLRALVKAFIKFANPVTGIMSGITYQAFIKNLKGSLDAIPSQLRKIMGKEESSNKNTLISWIQKLREYFEEDFAGSIKDDDGLFVRIAFVPELYAFCLQYAASQDYNPNLRGEELRQKMVSKGFIDVVSGERIKLLPHFRKVGSLDGKKETRSAL